MTGDARRWLPLREYPLFVGMLTATLASGAGVAVNIATEMVGNPIAWLAVAVLTMASGGTATWVSKDRLDRSSQIIEETLNEEIPKRLRSERRSTSRRVSKGVVKRTVTEIRPDGTRLQTIEFFSEELAREDNGPTFK
ncbi:hypothetical protein GCM10023193_23170 [Planotetraspora kaengkrachanensis]|uniref:Uncharacterized protein n=1 Tax=Planotetraspora kaengkrachanensis TaxID=575193 RepID=A0A8J3M623_9ACTN|nr:hypothetical protein Pka01_30980 [Planotetraspora kaengkrachanensis]